MVPASAQSTHLHRTRPCVHSLSHMPTQAVANPPKPLGLLRRPADSGSRRNRSTICGNTRCTFASTVVAMVAALVDEHETRLFALLQPNHCPMQPVLHCVCGIPCSSPCLATAPLHTVHAMVPASAQSTHLHRTRPCVHSLSHMPTQAVANPPKPLGLLRRPADSGSRRSRSTICGNTRCTFAFTVVAMVAALVDEH